MQEEVKNAVLLRIDPRWHDAIASGKKTVEVRTSIPVIEPPFRVYMCKQYGPSETDCHVVGEFTCDGYDRFTPVGTGSVRFKRFRALHDTCMSIEEICNLANGEPVFGWRISDLRMYTEPVRMNQFYEPCIHDCGTCDFLCYDAHDEMPGRGEWYCGKGDIPSELQPPTDWCYVEKLD